MAVELYSDQIAALDKLHTGSILRGGVGSGKTRTALAYYYTKVCGGKLAINGYGKTVMMKHKKPLYVITTAKTRDEYSWLKEAIPFYDVEPIVDSWNNIKKYVDVKNAFFIFDEQRVVCYSTWAKTFIRIAKNNDWILLSATPGDTWIEYAPIFIANGFYRNMTDFRSQHVIYSRFTKYPKIERYINTDLLSRRLKSIVVPMSDNRLTIPHQNDVEVSYNKELFDRVCRDRWNVFENRPIRNASEFCYTLRKIVNSDDSRLQALEDVLKSHPKLIVFYNFDYELAMLEAKLQEIHYPYSQWNGHKHESILEGKKWVYLVQYSAGAEGWNCITTDTVLYFSQTYSYKIMEQSSGRINRMNTPFIDLYYYKLVSSSSIDKAISKSLKNKKDFNAKAFCNSNNMSF